MLVIFTMVVGVANFTLMSTLYKAYGTGYAYYVNQAVNLGYVVVGGIILCALAVFSNGGEAGGGANGGDGSDGGDGGDRGDGSGGRRGLARLLLIAPVGPDRLNLLLELCKRDGVVAVLVHFVGVAKGAAPRS